MFTTLGATFFTTGAKLVAAFTVWLKGASCTFSFGRGEAGCDLALAAAALLRKQIESAAIKIVIAGKFVLVVSLYLMKGFFGVKAGARMRAPAEPILSRLWPHSTFTSICFGLAVSL